MRSRPIAAAELEFSAGAPPRSPRFGDFYHPLVGAPAQARHVFLRGNGLPQRWAGRRHFVVLETGFGLGNNFLATWDAWRRDPARCRQLHFVSVELHPLRRDDLARAHEVSAWPELAAELVRAWPPLVPGLQVLDFDGGAVQLLLALGDVTELLPTMRLRFDALYLDGFAPARNPQMWQPRVLKALGRMAAPEATAATWSVARELRDGLTTAGFEVGREPGIGGKREVTVARHAPRFAPRFGPGRVEFEVAPADGEVVVVGAGLAGAAAAQALARRGRRVCVIDRCPEPAAGASGNPAGIFHGSVHGGIGGGEGPHARLLRAAALEAARNYAEAIHAGVPGSVGGLLQVGPQRPGPGLPADYVQSLAADEARRLAGVPLPGPARLYPGGGWIAPAAWIRHALSSSGVRFVGGVEAARLVRCGSGWQLLDEAGTEVARAPAVVLANADSAATLLAPLGHGAWPLQRVRGQVNWRSRFAGPTPTLPIAGDGYLVPLPGGGLLCGATRDASDAGDDDVAVRPADLQRNLQRLEGLIGAPLAGDDSAWSGRVGWRLVSDDRLPLAGAMPLVQWPAGQRLDQARLLPREQGLFVLTALGSRGLTLAPLLARWLAAQLTGTPWPLPQDLADAVDPARWIVRRARRAAGQPAG